MKIIFTFFIILLIMINFNCTTSVKQDNKDKIVKSDTLKLILSPAQTVVGFLKWYNDNLSKIQKIYFIDFPEHFDSTKFYRINFDSIEKYINTLKSSGFISEYYLDSFRKYFRKCDKSLKQHPQNDGPPDGLSVDLIMWSNSDYEYELSNLDKIKIVKEQINGDKAVVILRFIGDGERTYDMIKDKDKWMIKMTQNTIDE